VDREITLRDYGRVLWSGRWIILAATVAAAVVGLLLTVVSTTTYTAVSRVYLGQPTSVTGVPLSTPATNPATAPVVLKSDTLVNRTAERLGVRPERVRSGVTISAPRAPGGAGNQPTLATVSFSDRDRRIALEGANAYAEEILKEASRTYRQVVATYETQRDRASADVERLQAQIAAYQRDLRGASGTDLVTLQSLLFSATEQLSSAQDEVSDYQINLAKAEQSEAPTLVETADNPSSSGSAPARLRTTIFAGIIGFLIGVLLTFLWRGSPAGRAGRA
jgi:uncharacterized protein involved in exopolysaccharide biosynthesis